MNISNEYSSENFVSLVHFYFDLFLIIITFAGGGFIIAHCYTLFYIRIDKVECDCGLCVSGDFLALGITVLGRK